MIIEAIPNKYSKSHRTTVDEGMAIFGIDEIPFDSEKRIGLIRKIGKILESAPYPKGRADAELIRGKYLSSVGVVYGLLLAAEFGWEMCWLRKANDEIEEGVKCLVSPDRAYFFAPIGVASKELYQHGGQTLAVYEKIKSGNLPDIPPGSFHEIKP